MNDSWGFTLRTYDRLAEPLSSLHGTQGRLIASWRVLLLLDMDGLIKFPVNLMSMSHKRLSFNITTTSASYS